MARSQIDGCLAEVARQRGMAVLLGFTRRKEARPKAPSQLACPERLRFAAWRTLTFLQNRARR